MSPAFADNRRAISLPGSHAHRGSRKSRMAADGGAVSSEVTIMTIMTSGAPIKADEVSGNSWETNGSAVADAKAAQS